ncbi:class I SAM-dependent methyltransferase [Leeia sp. TBRC 13508]|uniref:Class I SAM-dependent methyltransferase n=1 Tax=Leeia speluncae TaxID=2884804 RepID=A0ABS8DB68_9NEIS|nr:class I SAM-dependent methyltransferase [Leeia speluncae]MCB6185397.1 class I SAM-dependent methyltransferase [Leeia speluncae]
MTYSTNKTILFYNENAQDFYDSTINVDMASLYKEFLPLIQPLGHILDAGCGSGRDSNAFLTQGFKVTAIDASAELAVHASKFIGQPVIVTDFQSFNIDEVYDGIWACASMLHIPLSELNQLFIKFSQLLRKQGVFYCSFKYGADSKERNGRFFTDLDELSLHDQLVGSELYIEKSWITTDLRPNRSNEKWLNAILRKA